MRLLLAASLGLLAACNDTPVVEIVSPAPDTLVTDHGSIGVELLIHDDNVRTVELLLDGAPASAFFDLATMLPEDGECDGGCAPTIAWMADEAREGTHTLTARVTDELDEVGEAEITMTFEDVPTATIISPTVVEQVGVAQLAVAVAIVDRGDLDAALMLDGEPVDASLSGDCRYGCQLVWMFDTAPLTGEHVLDVSVVDQDDRSATATQAVVVGDIPYVTAIEITNESDTGGFGTLEVEVHVRDAETDGWIGCTGDEQGLDAVAESDVHYDVLGFFVDSTGARIAGDDLAGKNLEFVVVEDDNFQCPGPLDLIGDDHVGTSPPVAAADLPGHAPLAFEDVVELVVDLGRPY